MKTVSTLVPLLLLVFSCRLCGMTGAHDYDPRGLIARGEITLATPV